MENDNLVPRAFLRLGTRLGKRNNLLGWLHLTLSILHPDN